MPGNFKKYDLRILKTHKALMDALLTLLKQRNFNQLTVNDLCEEAQLSRATFYVHFTDKYDLLRHLLSNIQAETIIVGDTYEQTRDAVNATVQKNARALTNLLDGANGETLGLVRDFLTSILDLLLAKGEDARSEPNYIVLSGLFAGGVLDLLLWQIKNGFPPDMPLINPHSYAILDHLLNWDAKLNEH